jgi:tricorn protease-like protein
LLSFVSDRDGPLDVWVMDFDGANTRNVTNHAGDDFASCITGDCSRVIFDTHRDGNWEIYSIKLDGTDLVRLTNHPAADQFPACRP